MMTEISKRLLSTARAKTMTELSNILQQLGADLINLFTILARLAAPWWPVLVWVAFWLWAVDWRKLWPRLAEGAWAPLTLIGIMVALIWSSLSPEPYSIGGVELVVFWWQLLAVATLISSALFFGWLQCVAGWYPAEIAIEAPATGGHGHDHGQGSGHDDGSHAHGHAHDPHTHAAH
jgi:hypothetical protein